jgi:two-component system, chemotaxis family, sensor kinase Cph1
MSENINLENVIVFDSLPIHAPGSIQPHGILIILNEKDLDICQVSHNTKQWFNYEPEELINQPLSIILNDEQINNIKNCLEKDFSQVDLLVFNIQDNIFQVVVHKNKTFIFLELEHLSQNLETNFFRFYKITRAIIKEFQNAKNLEELSQIIAHNIRKITGFDRVMIYRFDEDHSGNVIGEEKREDLEPFLGLHYPPSDVGDPAISLYKINLIRLIPDIDYTPVKLPNHPETNEPFDLSLSVLRSVYPCHIEYLKNMGVKASFCISLIHNNELWGLISCHHYTPKYIPYDLRTLCEFLGQLMSIEVANKEENENLAYQMDLKHIQSNLIKSLSESNNLVDTLLENIEPIQTLLNSQGIVICLDNELFTSGVTPSNQEIEELIDWLEENKIDKDIFSTNKLPEIYPKANKFKHIASGILILALTRVTRHYIMWFRPEVIQTVNWGGNPNETIKTEENGKITFRPRQSFEEWKETVKNTSLPWHKYDIQEAMELKTAIVGLILQKSDELAALNLELQQSNSELDAFTYIASHDLKEPLRGIHNYSNFLLEDYGEILTGDGQEKLNTLVRLTTRMEQLIEALLRYSRLGRTALEIQSINLNESLKNIINMLQASFQNESLEIRIPQSLPTIEGDQILVEELLTNLITNGLKYNNKENKWVEVGYLEEENNDKNESNKYIFYVKDNGIGIREKHLDAIFRIFKRLHGQNQYGGGTGAGLTIVKRIIERHGGKIWVESIYGEGTTFYFTLA